MRLALKLWCASGALAIVGAIGAASGQSWNNWQAFQPFKNNVVARSSVGTGLVFSADLVSDVTATVGTNPTLSQPNNPQYFADTISHLSTASSVPAQPSTIFGAASGTGTGLSLDREMQNLLLQSEDISTTWTLVGTASRTINTTVSPDGATTGDTLTSVAANDGIQQSTSQAAASQTVVGSFFAKVASGTKAVTVTLEGASGGTPETSTYGFTATTSWQRFFTARKVFTGAATGNIRFKLTIDAVTSDVIVWGFMIRNGTTVPYRFDGTAQMAYIRSVTTNGGQTPVSLSIASSNFASAMTTGSISFWIMVDAVPGGSYMTHMNGDLLSLYNDGTQMRFFYNNATVLTSTATTTPLVPAQFFVTWDRTNSPGTFKLYKNSSLITTNTDAATAPTAATMYIGRDASGNDVRFCPGIYSRLRIYNQTKDQTFITANYNAEKENYGL
jgi:hypothetical protein